MKGIHGLIIAVFLGIAGLAANWYYLYSKTKDIDSVDFIGVKQSVTIRQGETFRESHFQPVRVPSRHAAHLKQYIYLYDNRNLVVGIPATRDYQGGDVILRADYRTPASEVSWYPESKVPRDRQRLMWVTIDDRNFVPSLVDPGDHIWFVVPEAATRVPTPAGSGDDGIVLKANDSIGPFRVGSLGNRLGSAAVMKSKRIPQASERQVGIVVQIERSDLGVEQFDAQTQQLMKLIGRHDHHGLTVLWSPAEES
jgi:hypothetical protein